MRRRGGGLAWVAAVLLAAGCSGGSPAAPGAPAAGPATARPAPSPKLVPTPAPTSAPAVTVGWSGDAVPASVDSGLPPDPVRLLAGVTAVTSAPDVMIGNLEGTLTDHAGDSKCRPGRTDCVAFRAPPAYAGLFARAGYDVLSLANNHAHDHGEAGLAQTRQAVRAAGLLTTGGPEEIAVRTVRGVRVAVVGFAPYGWAAPLNDPAAVRALVARAAARADVVIVVFHGGAEGAGALHVPAGRETAFGEDRGDLRAFARIAVAAGADAVLGAGPHVVRGAEVVGGRPVAYSVGNLVGYRALSTAGVLGTTAIVAAHVPGRRPLGRRAPGRHPPGCARVRRDRPVPYRDRPGRAAVPGGLRRHRNADRPGRNPPPARVAWTPSSSTDDRRPLGPPSRRPRRETGDPRRMDGSAAAQPRPAPCALRRGVSRSRARTRPEYERGGTWRTRRRPRRSLRSPSGSRTRPRRCSPSTAGSPWPS